MTERINALKARIAAMSNEVELSRRLRTMPGVGPITALAVETFAPPMDQFRRRRDFAAWLGLVPRQHSTSGRHKLGGFSKMADRPEPAKALHLAKVTGATLLIAKLDRLSRNAAFLLTLRDSGGRFVAADMPEANDLTVGIMALVAEQEREAISKRTREALAAAKARGVRLGNPNGAAALRRAGRAASRSERPSRGTPTGTPRICGQSWRISVTVGPPACGRHRDEMNARGILTRRGGRWHVSNLMNLLRRLDA